MTRREDFGMDEAKKKVEKPTIDWVAIEKHFRAGIKPLRTIGEEYDCTEGAIRKRALKDGWSRDLRERIAAKTEEKVRKAAVRKPSTQLTPATESQVVEANADLQAGIILAEQVDGGRHRAISRNLLSELEAITNDLPNYQKLGELFDESGPDANGAWKKDALNDIYKKVISLTGRIDSAKKLSETHEKNVNIERKVHGIEDGEGKPDTVIDMLKSIGRKLRAEQDKQAT